MFGVIPIIRDASGHGKVYLVGHSYGGSVALKAAMSFPEKTEGLLLLEPNPFYLLRQNQRMEGYREALELRDQIRKNGSKNNWTPAAEFFANYWIGPGALENMSEKRKHIFIEGLKPNLYEWGMLEEQSTLEDIRNLSKRTMLIYDPKTVRSILEITELLKESTNRLNLINSCFTLFVVFFFVLHVLQYFYN